MVERPNLQKQKISQCLQFLSICGSQFFIPGEILQTLVLYSLPSSDFFLLRFHTPAISDEGVFALEESLESLENGQILLVFPHSGDTLESLSSLNSLFAGVLRGNTIDRGNSTHNSERWRSERVSERVPGDL